MFGKAKTDGIPAYGSKHFATLDEVGTKKLLTETGIPIGYYREPGVPRGWGKVLRYSGPSSLLLVSQPRSGKMTDILCRAIVDNDGDRSYLIVDPRGQLACVTKGELERLGYRVVVLNPFGEWADILGVSARCNPLDALDPASADFAPRCRKFAEILISSKGERDGMHFVGGARGLVAGVIGALVAHGSDETKNLGYMREVICNDRLLRAYARPATKSPHAFIRQELAIYTAAEPPNPAEIAGFKQTAREQTSFLGMELIADNLKESDFAFSGLKHGDQPTAVFVILPDDQLDGCAPWFRLITAFALDELWHGGRGKYRVLAIVDEFASLGNVEVFERCAAAGAGRGIQLWPVVQSLTQLQRHYPQSWEIFLSGDIQIYLNARDNTTADYVSKMCGQRTVMTASQSVNDSGPFGKNNESDTTAQAGQPLVRPDEVCSLGPNEALILGPQCIVIDALRQAYFHTPELKDRYAIDPLHEHDDVPPAATPDEIVTLADILAAAAENAARAQEARRPLALRLLQWRSSKNRALNVLLKIEYLLTLPFRLFAAALAAPFALHNKPLGVIVGFLALFGLGEVVDGIIKQPVLTLYRMKSMQYQAEAMARDPQSMGDVLNSNFRAMMWLMEYPFISVLHPHSPSDASGNAAVESARKSNGFFATSSTELDRQARAQNNAMRGAADQFVERAINKGVAEVDMAQKQSEAQYAAAHPPENLHASKELPIELVKRHPELFRPQPLAVQEPVLIKPDEVQALYDAGIALGACGQAGEIGCDDFLRKLQALASQNR